MLTMFVSAIAAGLLGQYAADLVGGPHLLKLAVWGLSAGMTWPFIYFVLVAFVEWAKHHKDW